MKHTATQHRAESSDIRQRKSARLRVWHGLWCMAVLLLLAPSLAHAQTGTIEGRVTDAQTGDPLPGVNVVVADLPDEGLGAATNAEGEYVIEEVPAGDHTLEARYIGFETMQQDVTVAAGETATLDFALGSSTVELNEVVVSVAAGDLTRRETGVDIASVPTQELENAVASNLSELLNARAQNVTISQSSGNVGAGSRIRIRGISSLTQDNNPLLIIDGVRVSNNTATGITRGQTFSRFNDINPQDIKNIQVVKGPAATALYGSEAAPGVIIIETKDGRGTEGTQVTFRSEASSFQDVTGYPDNYADVTQYGITETGDPRLDGWSTAQHPLTGQVFVTDNPFEDAATSPFRAGYSINNDISLQGSLTGFNYYTSLGYQDQRGVMLSNDSDQLNFRVNLQGSPSELLNISANSAYISSTTNLPKSGNNTSGFFLNALDGQPLSSLNASDECLASVLEGADPSFCDKNGNVRAGFDKIAAIISREDIERFNTSLRLDLTPTSWLITTAKLGADVINQTFQDAIPYDPDIPFGFAAGGENFITRNQVRNYTADLSARVNYDLSSAISGNTALGAQYFQDRIETVSCEGRVFPNDQATACDAGVSIRGFSDYLEKVELGAYVQQSLGFNDYLFVTGALRVDDNSALGAEEPAIWSPSANASFVASDLPTWSIDAISQLRLRLAWGKASQSPEPYSADQTFVITRLGRGGEIIPGLSPSDPGNPNLGPERSEEFEAGLDMGFLEDRIGFDFTYYRQNITDAIVARPVAPSLGFPNDRFVNIGRLENHGLEANLDAQLVATNRVSWDARLGLSTAYSEVADLGFDEPIFIGASQVLQEGFAPGAYISRVITDAERDENGNIIESSIQYAEGNLGDGSGRRVVGQPFPNNTQSLSSTLTLFNNLQVYTLFERKGGHQIFSGTLSGRNPNALDGLQSSFGELWAYRQVQSSPTEQAMMEQDRLLGSHDAVWIHDADFIKWRELRVSYTLPARFAERIQASQIRLYAGGRNLLTLTDYPGLDPELNQTGARDNLTVIESNALPPARSLFGGFSLTF